MNDVGIRMQSIARLSSEQTLRQWGESRDPTDLVVRAYSLGITKSRIAELTGLSRTTVDRMLKKQGGVSHDGSKS